MKYMNFRASKTENVHCGTYTLSDDKVEAALLYPGLRPTVLIIRLRLRGTTIGSNNRLDLLALVTSGVNDTEASNSEEKMCWGLLKDGRMMKLTIQMFLQ